MIVNNSNFKLDEIPNYHADLEYYERSEFWKVKKRRCIEGYWSSGKWMPGPLYYYINFHKILFEDDSSVSQAVGLPWLRDIDWELFLYYEECRGFSGFAGDTKNTCDRKYGPEKELSIELGRITKKEAESKNYIPAREYLRKFHLKPLGKPLYKNESKHFFSIQSRGGGKATPWFTKVYTPDGYKLMRDISVGDHIIGSKGTPIKVLQKHPQGKQETWEVEFQDGRKSTCNKDHLWEVTKRGSKKKEVLTTEELYNNGVTKDLGYRIIYKYYIPQTPKTLHTEKELTIPPYVLGSLLGDGAITGGTPRIASSDNETIELFKKLLPDYILKHDESTTNNYTIVYNGKRGKHKNRFGHDSMPDKTNPLTQKIRKLGIDKRCVEKFIPEIYKYSSVEQRLELVRGLMDSDGSITTGGNCEFTNSSEQLVKDLAEVLRSLGIRCMMGKPDDRVGEIHEIKGHLVNRNLVMYRLHITPGDTIIFNLSRKKERQTLKTIFSKVAIKNIRKLDCPDIEQFCVTVDAEDSLYLTEDYIVTHNSYGSSGIADHNFLFDGATDYDVYLERKKSKDYIASDTIIGAIDTKYTVPLISKCTTAFKHMPGTYKMSSDEVHPSPLMVTYSGSTAANKELVSQTGSLLRHKTFKDNPIAANGTRPNLVVIDEVGFMYNIKESWGAIEATQASKQKKNLVIWALGTGGLVSGKAALYAESIFRNPDDYNCIAFDDEFENRGKIGYFVPYWKTLNEFKDKPDNITDEKASKKYIKHRRDKAKKSSDPSVYQTEIINGPMVPSEAFLVVEGAYFPTLLLKEQLSEVEGGKYKKYVESSFKGYLVEDENGIIDFVTAQHARPIRDYPLGKNDDKEGCVEIWVKPQKNVNGVVPSGTIIAGIDVVDKAKSTTDSLPSIVLMNKFTREIVAEYTGRTDNPKDFYEICRKLLLYYNATGMYEQNLVGLFTHFEQNKCLYLLADTPYQLRNSDTYKVGTNTSKGISATTRVNSTARDYIKSWLLEKLSINSGKRVIETIYSSAMLKELIMWNPDGNFDRVSSLGMMLWHDATSAIHAKEKIEEVKTFLDNPYFKNIGVHKEPQKIESVFSDFEKFN